MTYIVLPSQSRRPGFVLVPSREFHSTDLEEAVAFAVDAFRLYFDRFGWSDGVAHTTAWECERVRGGALRLLGPAYVVTTGDLKKSKERDQ